MSRSPVSWRIVFEDISLHISKDQANNSKLGIFVTIVDVVRIYYLQQAVTTSPTTPNDPTAIVGDIPEFAWNASLSLMWSAVEVNVGLVCAW